MRHYRLRWGRRGTTAAARGTAAPRIPRLRQRGHRHPRRGPSARSQAAGRLANLLTKLAEHPAPGSVGIGHTRWATHGPANDRNAHPHVGGDGAVVVVHNGVIENYLALKRELEAEGAVFRSDTDTEVIAHLIARQSGRRSASGRRRRAAAAQGDLRTGRRQPADPGVGRRRPPRQPLVLGHGERRMLPRQRRDRPGGPRRQGSLPQRPPVVRPDGPTTGRSSTATCGPSTPLVHVLDAGRRRSTWATTTTTCSRRSTSSPRRWRTPCAAGWTRATPPPTSAASTWTRSGCARSTASS